MKKFNTVLSVGLLSGIAVVLTLSSCLKKYDAKSYAPSKPLPSFNGYTSSTQIQGDALIDYWNFSGTLKDSITNLPGTATGSTFSTGVVGQGYHGALNQYAVCQSSPAIAKLQQFTVSVWINTGPPTTGVLDFFTLANTSQFWGNIEMFFDNGSTNDDAHVRIHLNSGGADNTFAAEVPGCFGAWVNLVFSYNQSGVCTLYLNGTSVATGTAGSLKGPLAFSNVGNVVFGCTQFMTTPSQTTGSDAQPWASYIVGGIDQVRVYNTVLTDNEVSALTGLGRLGR